MLKTLADCKPSEFLKQTNRVRKAVARWLTDTDILNIRRRMPEIRVPPDGTVEEKAAAFAAQKREQARKNLSAMLDAMLEEHPDETLEVLALCCFVEPEDVDSHEIVEYLDAIYRLITDEAVIRFFTSLAQLGQIGTLPTAKASE